MITIIITSYECEWQCQWFTYCWCRRSVQRHRGWSGDVPRASTTLVVRNVTRTRLPGSWSARRGWDVPSCQPASEPTASRVTDSSRTAARKIHNLPEHGHRRRRRRRYRWGNPTSVDSRAAWWCRSVSTPRHTQLLTAISFIITTHAYSDNNVQLKKRRKCKKSTFLKITVMTK